MKTHNFKLIAFPADGTILIGAQYAPISLVDEEADINLDGHMLTIGLFFIKLVYVYAKM
tara:strand:- start:545 stop:721 length:177 start_codon:yes stop_codon:yes gene_type:complete